MVAKIKYTGPELEISIIKPTVTRKDISTPTSGNLEITDLISNDAGNGLELGSDNKLYVDVSTTDVTINTDLSAYLVSLVNG